MSNNRSSQPNRPNQPNSTVQSAAHACLQAQTAMIPLVQKLNPNQKVPVALAQQINAQLDSLYSNFQKITSSENNARSQSHHLQGWTPAQTEATAAAFDALNSLCRNLDKTPNISLSTITHIYYLMGAFFGSTLNLVSTSPANAYLNPSRREKRKAA